MDLQLLKNTKPFGQILALLLIILGLGVFISLLGILISSIFIDGNIIERLQTVTAMEYADDLWLMKISQVFSQLGVFVFPAFLFAFLVNKHVFAFLKLDEIPKIPLTLLSLLIIISALPLSDWLIYNNNLINLPESLAEVELWMRKAEEKAAFMTNLFLQMDSWSDYFMNIIMIGILAAVGEELILRGILQPIFIKLTKNAHIGIIITAFIFSFIHFQFYGFFARFFMGVILGYLFYYTNNLWIPIIVHFFNNASAVSYVFFTDTPLNSTNLDSMTLEESGNMYAFISMLLVVAGLFVLKYYSHRLNQFETKIP